MVWLHRRGVFGGYAGALWGIASYVFTFAHTNYGRWRYCRIIGPLVGGVSSIIILTQHHHKLPETAPLGFNRPRLLEMVFLRKPVNLSPSPTFIDSLNLLLWPQTNGRHRTRPLILHSPPQPPETRPHFQTTRLPIRLCRARVVIGWDYLRVDRVQPERD